MYLRDVKSGTAYIVAKTVGLAEATLTFHYAVCVNDSISVQATSETLAYSLDRYAKSGQTANQYVVSQTLFNFSSTCDACSPYEL